MEAISRITKSDNHVIDAEKCLSKKSIIPS
jgi:hypothetical protein